MSNVTVTELSPRISLSYEFDKEAHRHIQIVWYKFTDCKYALLKAVSEMGKLSHLFLLSSAFTEHAFFVEPPLKENKDNHSTLGRITLTFHERDRVIRDLDNIINEYQYWDPAKEHVKGNIDFRILTEYSNIEVLLVPYIQKEKLGKRPEDKYDRYDNVRKAMLKVKVRGTRSDTITRELVIGSLDTVVPNPNYQSIVDDIVNKYNLDSTKEN